MTHQTIHDFLHARTSSRSETFDTLRIQVLVDTLGHPEKAFPVIHVAGTNGKGSTCAMLEAIYRANNYTTGLYTSPHLVHEGEMIQVNRRPLTDADLTRYAERLKPIVAAMSANAPNNYPSFFELMTAIAFLHFAESKVDLAIIETGVGGLRDATNVVDPELSILTSVSLDHTDLLGDTIEQIAKAGNREVSRLAGRLKTEFPWPGCPKT